MHPPPSVAPLPASQPDVSWSRPSSPKPVLRLRRTPRHSAPAIGAPAAASTRTCCDAPPISPTSRRSRRCAARTGSIPGPRTPPTPSRLACAVAGDRRQGALRPARRILDDHRREEPRLVFWSLPGGNIVMSSAFFEGGKFSGRRARRADRARATPTRSAGTTVPRPQHDWRRSPDAASPDPNRRLLALSEILVAIAKRNPFQIGQERQADTIALDLLARSGYDPRSLVMLMKKLQRGGAGAQPRRIRDHAPELARAHRRGRGPARGTDSALREVQGRNTRASRRRRLRGRQQQMRQPGSREPQRPPQKGAPRSTPSQLGVPAKPAPPASAQPAATAEPQPAAPAPAQPSAPATPPS